MPYINEVVVGDELIPDYITVRTVQTESGKHSNYLIVHFKNTTQQLNIYSKQIISYVLRTLSEGKSITDIMSNCHWVNVTLECRWRTPITGVCAYSYEEYPDKNGNVKLQPVWNMGFDPGTLFQTMSRQSPKFDGDMNIVPLNSKRS